MLPKKSRLDTKTADKVFKMGSFISSPNLNFKYIRNIDQNPTRISFVAPKNLVKTAVARNKLRRQGYQVLGRYINSFPAGLAGVFVFKKSLITLENIENEVKNICNKVN